MKNTDPLVSIGLPVYNGKHLREALNSLQSQTYKNIEIIISDNASTDSTAKICRTYLRDSRIKYIRQKANIGAAKNFNFVLSKAKGEYFMWAAGDDVWNENYIKLLMGNLSE